MWPGKSDAERRAAELQELQLKVMRFADEYSGRIYDPIERFKRATETPEERLTAHNWRLSQATSAYTIASGPNPITNALDMVVLATLSRMVVEDGWTKALYGERANEVAEVHRRLEPEAWRLLDGVLTPDQLGQLHTVIDRWREQNPEVRGVAYIHFRDFAKSIGEPRDEAKASGGLFALLGLDPLSSLDPAVREIAQTRQLAERSIYYVQRAPNLLDMQVERLTYELAVMPETKTLLANADRFGAAATSARRIADDFPATLARERQAAIDQIFRSLGKEQAQLQSVLDSARSTLDAGTATSQSLRETIDALDRLSARFKPTEPVPPKPAGKPFDINEYTALARELQGTAQQLSALLAQLDSSSASAERLTASAATGLGDVVDHAFWRAVQLLIILAVLAVAAGAAYRWISSRLVASRASNL
jgi:hypothetical protein